jgi:hypothetical protein
MAASLRGLTPRRDLRLKARTIARQQPQECARKIIDGKPMGRNAARQLIMEDDGWDGRRETDGRGE